MPISLVNLDSTTINTQRTTNIQSGTTFENGFGTHTVRLADRVVANPGQNINLGAAAVANTDVKFNNGMGQIQIFARQLDGGDGGNINFLLL